MEMCLNHPDTPGHWYCARYNRWLCDDCATCQSPGIYCKFCSGCLIAQSEKMKHIDDPVEMQG